jgi:hypothetical protein
MAATIVFSETAWVQHAGAGSDEHWQRWAKDLSAAKRPATPAAASAALSKRPYPETPPALSFENKVAIRCQLQTNLPEHGGPFISV